MYVTRIDNSDLYGPVVAFFYRLRFAFLLCGIVVGIVGAIMTAVALTPTNPAPLTFSTVQPSVNPANPHGLAPCRTEDSSNCFFDANARHTGGQSFWTDANGTLHYS